MQQFELHVLWLEDSIGLSITQRISNKLILLTPYYFWPISKTWEQIHYELEAKIWISEPERTKILNSVVNIINDWQQQRLISTTELLENKKQRLIKQQGKLLGLP